MDLKEEFNYLVNILQRTIKEGDKKLSKEAIAKKMNLSRQYFSALLNSGEEIKKFHLDQLKAVYRDELRGKIPIVKTEEEVTQTASVKMLFNEVAKIRSKLFNQKYEDVIVEMEQNTTSIIKDILKNLGQS